MPASEETATASTGESNREVTRWVVENANPGSYWEWEREGRTVIVRCGGYNSSGPDGDRRYNVKAYDVFIRPDQASEWQDIFHEVRFGTIPGAAFKHLVESGEIVLLKA